METKIEKKLSPKRRMLNAYHGVPNDRPAVAPEFWYYYPAKVLGVDMIEFEREVPFHSAMKTTFEKFSCEGWAIVFPEAQNIDADIQTKDTWLDDNKLQTVRNIKTPYGSLETVFQYDRHEPSWYVKRPVVDPAKDIDAWLYYAMPECDTIKLQPMLKARDEVGQSYLLEVWLGTPFFDFSVEGREGGLERCIIDFYENQDFMKKLQARYIDYMVRKAEYLCTKTPFESFFIGCSWSCNSLIGPDMWRQWDKPVIDAIGKTIHKHGKLLHIHFHGKCMETLSDFAEMELDCICPFERPPGGDVNDLKELKQISNVLNNKVTMNGNVHTVETLIRGNTEDVRREVREILQAFKNNPRVIVGTGDQVGRETPEENIYEMIEEVKSYER